MGNIHFSIIGIGFLLMLFIPNIIWTKHMPVDYDASYENKFLLIFEKIGEVLVCCFAVIMFHEINWNLGVCISIILMLMYEGYWIQYFKSAKQLSNFYCSFLGIPLAGATLPVLAYLILGISQSHWLLVISTIILGIGHIGIHIQHFLCINN